MIHHLPEISLRLTTDFLSFPGIIEARESEITYSKFSKKKNIANTEAYIE